MQKFLDATGLAHLWANLSYLLNGKQDTLPTGQAGQVLTYDTTNGWVAGTVSGGSGSGMETPNTAGNYILTVDSNGDYTWTAVIDGNSASF